MKDNDLIQFDKKLNNKKIDLFRSVLSNSFYEHEKTKLSNMEVFKDSISAFNDIFDKCVLLTKKLGIDNPLDIANLYTALIWNGYFSVNKKYNFDDYSNLLRITSFYEFDIIFGKGNCLSNSFFISKLLNKHGIKSFPIHNLINDSKIENYSFDFYFLTPPKNYIVYDSKENIDIFRWYIQKRLGNHVNVFIDEEKKFIYDPTNIAMYKVLNKDKAELVTGTGTIDLKLLSSYIFANNDEEKEFLNKFINYEKFDCYTSFDFRKSYSKIKEIFLFEEDLLNEFRIEIYDDLLFIESDIINILKGNKNLTRKI